MIDGGAGLINVPLDKWDQWNELIANYYRTNDMAKIKRWTYDTESVSYTHLTLPTIA